jgi:hypothetical protein
VNITYAELLQVDAALSPGEKKLMRLRLQQTKFKQELAAPVPQH